MTAVAEKAEKLRRTCTDPLLELRAALTELPAGVCGQVEGVALVYDVVDTYGTVFQRGCLDRTVRERVVKGKVKLFWDHGDALQNDNGVYDTDLHIGTVRSLTDVRMADGRWVAWLVADLFDTSEGRKAKEYLRAVLATGGDTGLSVGVKPVAPPVMRNGREHFTECYLGEISITAMSSVPGTQVTTVRAEQAASDAEPPPEPAVEPAAEPADLVQPPSEPAATPETDPTLNYEPLLRGISAAVGADHFRVLTRGILGDAPLDPASDATGGTPAASSDADSRDRQPATTDVARTDLVPQTERLAFARAALVRLYE